MDPCTHPWVTAFFDSLDLLPHHFLPCWGTAQSAVAGFSLPSRQLSNGVWKTAGTGQTLLPRVPSATETQQCLVMPSKGSSNSITMPSLLPSHLSQTHWQGNEVPCPSTCPIWKSNAHISLQAIAILMETGEGKCPRLPLFSGIAIFPSLHTLHPTQSKLSWRFPTLFPSCRD